MKVQDFKQYQIGDIVQIVALASRQVLFRPHLSQRASEPFGLLVEAVPPSEEVILWLPKDPGDYAAWSRRYFYDRPYYFVGVKTVYEGIIYPSLGGGARWEPSHGVRLARLRRERHGKELLAWAIQPYMVPANRAISCGES